MESNWRFNVWELGMSHSTIRLMARLVGMVPDSYLIPGNSPPAGRHWYVRYSVFAEEWVIAGSVADVTPGNFPYGNDVDPD